MVVMTNKLNSSLDVAVVFFLICGGAYFLYYILKTNNGTYLLLTFLVYILSFLVRKFITKNKNKQKFSELGICFISLLFTAYTVYFTGFDNNIATYLPENILAGSGVAFIFLFLVQLLRPKKNSIHVAPILILFAVLIFFKGVIDSLFITYPYLSTLIIGAPYLYIISILVGYPEHEKSLAA